MSNKKRFTNNQKIGYKLWISHNFKKCLVDSGLTIKDLAQRTPLNVVELDGLIHGRFMPTLDVWLCILNECGNVFQIKHSDLVIPSRMNQENKPSKLTSIIINFD